jgi:hypothetical protein
MSPNLGPQGPDLGPPSSIRLSYMLPLAKNGGRRPPTLKPVLRTGGGRLRGHASHAHGLPCLQAPCIHAAVGEEDPLCHRRDGGPAPP